MGRARRLLLQLGVLGSGLFQDRDVRIGIFPKRQEILINRISPCSHFPSASKPGPTANALVRRWDHRRRAPGDRGSSGTPWQLQHFGLAYRSASCSSNGRKRYLFLQEMIVTRSRVKLQLHVLGKGCRRLAPRTFFPFSGKHLGRRSVIGFTLDRDSLSMDAERVRAQPKRILSSPAFADAERGSRFLRFVVTATTEGRSSEIKESVIGVEVLGRSASFDPKTDPIVRVEAGRLRSRLNTYYQNEGKADPVLISLPKGGYVPEFYENKLATRAQKTTHPAVFLMAGALMGFATSALLLFYFRKASEPTDVLRLSILPPRGAVIEHSAISPDGKRIAFSAVSAGKLELWIRPLDSLEATALPGTEDCAGFLPGTGFRQRGTLADSLRKEGRGKTHHRESFQGQPERTVAGSIVKLY